MTRASERASELASSFQPLRSASHAVTPLSCLQEGGGEEDRSRERKRLSRSLLRNVLLAINNREGNIIADLARGVYAISIEGGVASVKKGGIRKKEMEEERIVSGR